MRIQMFDDRRKILSNGMIYPYSCIYICRAEVTLFVFIAYIYTFVEQ